MAMSLMSASAGLQQPLQISCNINNQACLRIKSPSALKYHSHSAKLPLGFSLRKERIISSKTRAVLCNSSRKTPEVLAKSKNFHTLQSVHVRESFSRPLAMAAVLSGAVLMATRSLAAKVAAFILHSNPNIQALAFLPNSALGGGHGAVFFAATRIATPMTVIAAAMQKWLDLYAVLLTARILLSWFPNIPWERQPFAAMRDLSDPYLTLFRNIIPPVKNILDVSPMLAFAVLGFFRTVLENAVYVTVQ